MQPNKTSINNPSLGRKLGSMNKISGEAKKILFDALKDDLHKITRYLNCLPPNERLTHIKHFSKHLISGNDEISVAVRETIYQQLIPHFKRMGTFLSHVPQEKRFSELRQCLKLLSQDRIEEIITDMHTKQNINFLK